MECKVDLTILLSLLKKKKLEHTETFIYFFITNNMVLWRRKPCAFFLWITSLESGHFFVHCMDIPHFVLCIHQMMDILVISTCDTLWPRVCAQENAYLCAPKNCVRECSNRTSKSLRKLINMNYPPNFFLKKGKEWAINTCNKMDEPQT